MNQRVRYSWKRQLIRTTSITKSCHFKIYSYHFNSSHQTSYACNLSSIEWYTPRLTMKYEGKTKLVHRNTHYFVDCVSVAFNYMSVRVCVCKWHVQSLQSTDKSIYKILYGCIFFLYCYDTYTCQYHLIANGNRTFSPMMNSVFVQYMDRWNKNVLRSYITH